MSDGIGVGSISEDGNWIWDGQQWQSHNKTQHVQATPVQTPSQDIIQSTNNDFEAADKNKDGVIDRDEYIAKIMEDTLKKKEEEKAPDHIMKVMTVFILIFASCTGFVSQKVSTIEAEAAEYDADAELKLADARATEASENQLLLKEEILLTEAQNLAVQIENYESKITTQNFVYNNSIDEYFKPAVEIELLEFMLSGPYYITVSDNSIFNPIYYCMYSHIYTFQSNCKMENFSSFDGIFDYSAITYTIPEELDDIEFLVKDAFATLYNITTTSSILEITSVKSVFHESNQTYYFEIPVFNVANDTIFWSVGLEGELSTSIGYLASLEEELTFIEYNLAYIDNSLSIHFANWNYYTAMRNYQTLLAENYWQQGLFDLANDSYASSDSFHQEANNLVGLINQNNSFYSENQTDQVELRTQIQNSKQNIDSIQQRVTTLQDQINRLNPKLESQLEKIADADLELRDLLSLLNSTTDLKLDILNRSVAYQNGSVSTETGLFKSNSMKEDFTNSVRSGSQSKYSAAEDDQQEAQDLKDRLSSVATSILFISIANMLLGIAGGFSKNKQNKRNALILLIAGAACGIIGTSQIIPLL